MHAWSDADDTRIGAALSLLSVSMRMNASLVSGTVNFCLAGEMHARVREKRMHCSCARMCVWMENASDASELGEIFPSQREEERERGKASI